MFYRAVQRACNNLVQPDANISNAVEVRRELDLRICILHIYNFVFIIFQTVYNRSDIFFFPVKLTFRVVKKK